MNDFPALGDHVRVNDSTDGRLGQVAGYGFQQREDGTTTPVVLVRLLASHAGWATIAWDNQLPPTNSAVAIFVGMLAVHPDNIFRVGTGIGSVLADQ